ncbi:MAG: hypothetical protein U9R05_08365 [Chloroflexota bacterium]|nr:hypothetical protein [Chloroflexota bacterium]
MYAVSTAIYLVRTASLGFIALSKLYAQPQVYTWVEQQGKTYEEILAQWYDKDYWSNIQQQLPEIDNLIKEFNERVGLVK